MDVGMLQIRKVAVRRTVRHGGVTPILVSYCKLFDPAEEVKEERCHRAA
jgi:hypothetical protein